MLGGQKGKPSAKFALVLSIRKGVMMIRRDIVIRKVVLKMRGDVMAIRRYNLTMIVQLI